MDRAEPRLVLGTAGHIDHGKTALCRALTGVDTDRLPEEKARGITIELGFAPLDLEGGLRLGMVDVPGHEGLVRTMVAGASGIDLVLLVVAADEGVMPQTREHLAICELLGLSRGVVALTKCDTVDEEMAELAAEEVADLLAGTSLEGAPIARVSAREGTGIEELRALLGKLAADTRARTPRSGPPRLPVDRSFEMHGFGSVATGTLVGEPLRVGDAVEVIPSGARGRVRGIQNHGVAAPVGEPGARCALNLQGVALSELGRGSVVTRPDALAPTHVVDVELRWLPGAPRADKPVSVEFLLGTSERRARLAPIGAEELVPGERGFARIHLDGDPVAALPGDRFIVRGFARNEGGGATLGGGMVLDAAPPRRRRSDPGLRADLEALALRDPVQDCLVRVRRSGLTGIARERFERETGIAGAVLESALETLAGDVVSSPDGLLLAREAATSLERRLLAAVDAYHAAEPLRPGMPLAALRGGLPGNVSPDATALALTRLSEAGSLRLEADVASRPDHRVLLAPEDRAVADRVLRRLSETGLEAPAPKDLATHADVAPDRLRELLAYLEREGDVVHAPGDLWFARAPVEALRQRLLDHFAANDTLDTPTYKGLIGTTRRTAVPLMELFDAERFTQRRGDVRRLHRRS